MLVAALDKVLVLAQLHVLLLCLVPAQRRLAKKAELPDSGASSSSRHQQQQQQQQRQC
jgi:hypothetical protein